MFTGLGAGDVCIQYLPSVRVHPEQRNQESAATRIMLKQARKPRPSSPAPPPPPPLLSVTDGSHKWCTRDDFIWFMELLSSSLPTPMADLRFESLVRACWGIPEEGVVSESRGVDGLGEKQPVRALVTHADGSMSVERVSRQDLEEVEGDKSDGRLISEVEAESVRRRLASRGVHAVHVHLLEKTSPGGATPEVPEADGSSQEPAVGTNAGAISESLSRFRPGDGRQPSADEVRIATLGPSGSRHSDHDPVYFEEGTAGLGFDHGLLR